MAISQNDYQHIEYGQRSVHLACIPNGWVYYLFTIYWFLCMAKSVQYSTLMGRHVGPKTCEAQVLSNKFQCGCQAPLERKRIWQRNPLLQFLPVMKSVPSPHYILMKTLVFRMLTVELRQYGVGGKMCGSIYLL